MNDHLTHLALFAFFFLLFWRLGRLEKAQINLGRRLLELELNHPAAAGQEPATRRHGIEWVLDELRRRRPELTDGKKLAAFLETSGLEPDEMRQVFRLLADANEKGSPPHKD